MAGTSQGDHRWLLSPCYSQLISIITHAWGRGDIPIRQMKKQRLKEMKWLSWVSSLKGRAGTQCQNVWLQCRYAIHCPPLPLGSFCAGIPHQSIDITHQLKLHCFPGCSGIGPAELGRLLEHCSGWGVGECGSQALHVSVLQPGACPCCLR